MDVAVGAQATAAARGGTRSHLDALCIGLVFVAGLTLCMQVFSSNRLGARPQIEDEFVYLFQAKTLASGHLTYPSPPLPEFFEAAHILVVPRFAAKYLPGHALVLLPFLAAGAAWLAPCLLLGATAALLFVAARLAGLSRAAGVGAALMLLSAADVFPFFASYLSQSTSMATVAALIVAALAVERKPSAGRIAALAACSGFAVLVRPFTGLAALLVCAAVLVRLRRTVPVRTLAWAAPPLLAFALIAGVYCKAATGSWATAPWSLYARQYMPYDGPGIGGFHEPAVERGFPPHLHGLHDRFLESRERHTWARFPQVVLRRLKIIAQLAPSWGLIPFAIAGLLWTPLWSAWLFAAAFFLLQLTFHVGGAIYHLEIFPSLALAAAAGAQLLISAALRLRRPMSQVALAALAGAALFIAVQIGSAVEVVWRRASERAWVYARWGPAFEWFRERRALVFIRYPANWDCNLDLTYNEPDLARADVVRAIDRGARNVELMRYFPDRPAFVFDPISRRVEPLR